MKGESNHDFGHPFYQTATTTHLHTTYQIFRARQMLTRCACGIERSRLASTYCTQAKALSSRAQYSRRQREGRTPCSRLAEWIFYSWSQAATIQISIRQNEWINSELKAGGRYTALVSWQPHLNYFVSRRCRMETGLLSASGPGRQTHAGPTKTRGTVHIYLEGLLAGYYLDPKVSGGTCQCIS